MDLFDASLAAQIESDQPLAARLRPRSLDDFIGQEHILGPGRLLRRAIEADQLSSLVFYGPPGTGKTTLALVIANTTQSHFITINAVLAGVGEIRNAVHEAQERRKLHQQRTLLFIDEVHRFNKAQQDALLPWVENGTVILIGATTENPYFSVNKPLLSRSRVFQLKTLQEIDLRHIAQHALKSPYGYASKTFDLHPEALDHLVNIANGDARTLLNALELAVTTTTPDKSGCIIISLAVAEESIQQRAVLYDKEGDYHFDTISAFIKSLRGSDPDATLYWLARMVYAGEDPLFIFRRMLIFASEDIGLADPQALQIVTAAVDAFERVGLPEGRFPLAQAALYLATAPKSNSVFAFFDALAAVKDEQEEEVPNHLKDASRDSEGLGHGANYLYPHAYRDHWVAQQYLPRSLQGRIFYQPSDQGHEQTLANQVQTRREIQLAAMLESPSATSENLSSSPPNRRRDQWLQRLAGETSTHLAQIRQRLFQDLPLERYHRVLDLNAGTGLCTWEALRRVPEGGVWSLCTEKRTAVILEETATHLPSIERPTVLQGPLGSLSQLLGSEPEDLRFDALIGRNALGSQNNKEDLIADLLPYLAPAGRVRLVEQPLQQAQRLYRLINLEPLSPSLQTRLVEAEEAIYASTTNPQLNWVADNLAEFFHRAGFIHISIETEQLQAKRRIGLSQLGQWFNPGGEKNISYAYHLKSYLEPDEITQVHRFFEKTLVNQTVNWQSTNLYLSAQTPT